MLDSSFRLLSELYITLWGPLDALSDEHRWVRTVGERQEADATVILEKLQELSVAERLPVPVAQLEQDFRCCAEVMERWKQATLEKRKELRR